MPRSRDLFDERYTLEAERRRRIQVSIWAYTYEFLHTSIVDDQTFDRYCQAVDIAVHTNRPDLDAWFRNEFDPSTGLWIRDHPELEIIRHHAENLVRHLEAEEKAKRKAQQSPGSWFGDNI